MSNKSVVNAALKSCRRRSNTCNPEQIVRLKQANDASEWHTEAAQECRNVVSVERNVLRRRNLRRVGHASSSNPTQRGLRSSPLGSGFGLRFGGSSRQGRAAGMGSRDWRKRLNARAGKGSRR